jgi:hypothetical protein
MIDTGNAGSTIIEQYWAEQQGVTPLFDSALTAKDVRVALAELQLGPFTLAHEVVSYYGAQPRGSEHTRSVAAIAGEPLLSRFDLMFDYPHGLLWLKPLPNAAANPFNRSGLLLSKAADGAFRVSAVLSGSPAAEAGIKEGDVIEAVASQPSQSLSRADAMAMFQQQAGTPIETRLRGSSPTGLGRSVTLRLRDAL